MSWLHEKIALWKSFAFIVFSTILCSGGIYTLVSSFRLYHQKISNVHVHYLIQSAEEKKALPTQYLAELLDLSANHPPLLSELSEQELKNRLLKAAVIETAEVTKLPPASLLVSYKTYHPYFQLIDFQNVYLTKQFLPFLADKALGEKKLVEVYLGIKQIHLKKPLEIERAKLALEVMEFFEGLALEKQIEILRVDTSLSDAQSLGKRQLILLCQRKEKKHYLRLLPDAFEKQLVQYLALIEKIPQLSEEDAIIDLRLNELGYLTYLKDQ